MAKKLVNIVGDGVEELWYFPEELEEKYIKLLWEEYQEAEEEEDVDSFESFMNKIHPIIECERVFYEEIYV